MKKPLQQQNEKINLFFFRLAMPHAIDAMQWNKKVLLLLRAIAHVESANFPAACCGLKIITSLCSASLIFSERKKRILFSNRC
jgi:hypothetical protein